MAVTKGSLNWTDVDLHPWLRDAVASLGFPSMTPVQASTIPLLSTTKDVIVEAVTGSGKTLAFAIPVLQKVSKILYVDKEPVKKGHMLAVVLSPTRELANQIQAVFDSLLEYLPESLEPMRTQLLVGSLSSVREDLETFAKIRPQILIATPGRMLDFMSSNTVKTNSIEIVILDEADKLLDVSFSKEVINIVGRFPKQRRTGLFSATISAAGDSVFRTGMTNPVRVTVKGKTSSSAAPRALNISYTTVPPQKKITTLLKLLKEYRYKKAIVYFPTCTSVKFFYSLFQYSMKHEEIKFYSLHGQLATKPRLKTLTSFSEAETFTQKHILMTTDVAARGIDVPDVDLVIQIDPPTDPDVFLHRCGRTGRANKVGQALVFFSQNTNEEDFVDFMKVRGLEMVAMDFVGDENHDKFQKQLRNFILEDRGRHELAIKSYVGFVKYYSKHLASSIFRMSLLDYINIAKMYGLLRLPRMPETKYISNDDMPEDGWLGEKIDMDEFAYADKQKEKIRLQNLESDKEKKLLSTQKRKELKVKNEAWSNKTERKEVKQERRDKMKRKREAIEKQLMEESSDDGQTQVDWKDLVRSKKKKSSSAVQGAFDDL